VGDDSPGGPVSAERSEWLGQVAVEMKVKRSGPHEGMGQNR
jgi:hypothetical protein